MHLSPLLTQNVLLSFMINAVDWWCDRGNIKIFYTLSPHTKLLNRLTPQNSAVLGGKKKIVICVFKAVRIRKAHLPAGWKGSCATATVKRRGFYEGKEHATIQNVSDINIQTHVANYRNVMHFYGRRHGRAQGHIHIYFFITEINTISLTGSYYS